MKSERIKPGYPKIIGLFLVFASLTSIVMLYGLDITFLYEPKHLLGVTNTIFASIIPLAVAFFAARTYLGTGSLSVLLMGCGMLGFGLCAGSAGWLREMLGGANINVTIYNTGALLGSLCHVTGAVISYSGKSYQWEQERQKLAVIPAYSSIIVFAVLLSFATVQRIVPLFFVQGYGPTALRQIVLGLAILLYALSSLLFMNKYFRIGSDFLYWYSLCLAMLALGLFAFYIQKIVGSPIGWAGRTSNYVGTVFSMIAILAAVRSGRSKGLPLEDVISGFFVDAEANYKSLVETASDAIVSFDQDDRIILWNSSAERIFGYSKWEAIGSPVFGMLIPEGYENALTELIETSQGIRPYGNTVEIAARHKNGGLFPIEISAFVRRLSNGRVSTCIVRDITERKQAQEKIGHQNAIVNGINRIFRDALTCDTEEDLGRTCLAVAEELTKSEFGFIGETAPDGLHDIAISNPGWELCSILDKTGHRRAPLNFKIRGLYGRVLLDGKSLMANNPADHPDSIGTPPGHPRLSAFLGSPLILAGRTTGMIAVGNRDGGYSQADMETLEALSPAVVAAFARKRAERALRESEASFRSLFENMAEGVALHEVIYDESGSAVDYRILTANPAFEKHTGLAPEKCCGLLASAVYGTGGALYLDVYARTASSGEPHSLEAYFPALEQYFHVSVSSPKQGHFVTVFENITERKRMEEALNAARDEALSEQKLLQAVMEALPVGVALLDARGGTIKTNPEFERVWGGPGSAPQSAGDYGSRYRTTWLDSGRQVQPEEWASALAVQRGETIFGQLIKIERSDGTHAFVHNSAAPIHDVQGGITGCAVAVMDITDRIMAEQALRENEELFRLAVDNLPDALEIYDEQMRYKFVNAAGLRLSGLPLEAYIGRRDDEMFGPEITGTFLPMLQKTCQSCSPQTFECALNMPTGSYDLIITYVPMLRDGKVYQVLGFKFDITGRKRAEENLRTTVRRFHNILANIFVGILVVTEDDRVEFVNQDFCDQFGLAEAPSDSIGLTAGEMVQKVLPAYANPEANLARIRQTVSRRRRVEDEEITMRNGRVFLRDYIPILVDGNPRGRMWQHRDITERKRAEDELRKSRDELELRVRERTDELVRAGESLERQAALLNLAHDAIFVRGLDHTVKFWNHGAEELYGFTKAQAMGKDAQNLLHSRFPVPMDQIVDHVLKSGRWEGELLQTTSTGEKILVESRWALQPGRDGEPLGFLEINRDVTDRKLAEEALRSNMARLELVNAELQEFAYIASHDLQEPLRKIQTFSDMAIKRCAPVLDAASKDYLDRVINSAARMRQLLHDLLQFSRVAARAKPPGKIDLVKIVREAADVFEVPVKQTGCRIEIGSLPSIEADESQMLQLFQNLIGNALKFRGDGPPRIEVHGKSGEQGICEIRVKDNGIGFDPKFAELIFKPFQRLHGRGAYDGTGMGLAICRKIVERHGGNIRAESEPGKGSTFIIRLPVKQDKWPSM